MHSGPAQSWISLLEYYRLDAVAPEKSDWYDGEMFNRAGGTTNHSRIKVNLARALGNQLGDGPCETLDSDQRLAIISSGLRTYPDLSVYCGPIDYDEEDTQRLTATNPAMLFEVLSPSTEAYDRGLKAESYRQIPSLRAYALISQREPHIELYERQDDGSWRYTERRGLEEVTDMPGIGVRLSHADVYARVEFT